jgi:phosphoglycolate phosphatase
MSALIFDFDGTIADSFELVLDLFYELTGTQRFSEEKIIEFKKTTLRHAVKLVHLSPRQIPFLLIKGRAQMGKRLNEVKPFPGIQAVLESLHSGGHKLFIISSNSHHNVEVFLEEHNLSEYFDGVYGGVGLLSKAGALRKVIRQRKLDHSDTYYIGDESRDVIAAKRARVRAISVAWGYNDISILKAEQPYKIAMQPSDLLEFYE